MSKIGECVFVEGLPEYIQNWAHAIRSGNIDGVLECYHNFADLKGTLADDFVHEPDERRAYFEKLFSKAKDGEIGVVFYQCEIDSCSRASGQYGFQYIDAKTGESKELGANYIFTSSDRKSVSYHFSDPDHESAEGFFEAKLAKEGADQSLAEKFDHS